MKKTGMSKEEKVRYVKKQLQDRKHTCHWPDCEKQVPPAMWGCKGHWFRLPRPLRDRIWVTYNPGQESRMDPSEDYLKAASDVQRWIESAIEKRVLPGDPDVRVRSNAENS